MRVRATNKELTDDCGLISLHLRYCMNVNRLLFHALFTFTIRNLKDSGIAIRQDAFRNRLTRANVMYAVECLAGWIFRVWYLGICSFMPRAFAFCPLPQRWRYYMWSKFVHASWRLLLPCCCWRSPHRPERSAKTWFHGIDLAASMSSSAEALVVVPLLSQTYSPGCV
jgi:hypothetical protein